MKKTFILIILVLSSLVFTQSRDCSEILNPYECYDMGCEWTILYEEIENELILTEGCFDPNDDGGDHWDDSEYYCEDLTEDECSITEGCQWYDEEGCFRLEEEDNDFESCSDIEYLQECENTEGCEWMYNNNMSGYGSCVENEWENDDCDPDLACATVLTCYENLLYPTSCGPENCDEPIGECEQDNNLPECMRECEGFEYVDPSGDFLYFCDWLLETFPTGCAEQCDQNSLNMIEGWMIECDETNNDDGCFEDGEWYCFGCELFISDCEYVECTLNGWSEPYSLNNDECNSNDWECSDLGYIDCIEADYCEWSTYVTPNGFFEGCIEIEEDDNEGPPECLEDCLGINDIDPNENPYETCDWLISNFGPNNFFNECAYDCDDETMMEINEIVEACFECLENEDIDCSDIFNDDENDCFDLGYEDCLENSNCQPNYNAAGQYEGCGYYNDELDFGFLFGRVEYIYGDVIDFVSYATLQIESLPSNSDMVYFEVMTDAEGYYQIDLPVGFYIVTAFANEETLVQDIQITGNNEHELNFLLGEWNGPWYPYANLILGQTQGSPGVDVAMPLYLSSSEFVGGVQFTLQTGIENAASVVAIESIDACFSTNFNNVDNGTIGIIFSLEGCSYPPEEMLHVADIIFNINESFTTGNVIELFFTNTIVSDVIGNEIPSYGEGNIINIGILGDVNNDYEVNVLDVVFAINFVLYVEIPNDSEFWASDMNADNMINVLDIVQLVNLILND